LLEELQMLKGVDPLTDIVGGVRRKLREALP
jgi:hypothetical protein